MSIPRILGWTVGAWLLGSAIFGVLAALMTHYGWITEDAARTLFIPFVVGSLAAGAIYGWGRERERQASPIGSGAVPDATVVENASSDPIEQIRRLSGLRDQGALTDEEFEAKKAELLDRL